MPTQFNDAAPFYTGEALVVELHKDYSRDVITIASGAGVVKTCTVLGKITASGKYVPVAPAANDGSQVAASVNIDPVDATSADKKATGWTRGVVLNQSELNFGALNAGQIAAAIAQLADNGVVVRPALG